MKKVIAINFFDMKEKQTFGKGFFHECLKIIGRMGISQTQSEIGNHFDI
jgi:hypothetical protein